MSITRSSIPVCINCSAPRSSRRIPLLCVTATHSSQIPPAIVRDIARLVPEWELLLRVTVFPAGPPGSRSLGWPRLGHPHKQLLEKLLSAPSPLPTFLFLLYFLFPSCAFLFFALLDSSLPTPISAHSGYVSASCCFRSAAVS